MTAELASLVRGLASAGIELILVGGLAAVTQGVPTTTFDVDIVPRREQSNIRRLMAFLRTHDARYRGRPPDSVLRPRLEDLLGPGHHLLLTDLGPLDILGTIDDGLDYEALLPSTSTVPLGGQDIRVLSLRHLLAAKERSPRAKDQAMVPLLRATLARSTKG